MNQDDLDEQMKTLMSFKIPESRWKFWREVWQLFLILFFFALGLGIFAVGQYWACVSRWPDKTFMQCMKYDVVETSNKRIRK